MNYRVLFVIAGFLFAAYAARYRGLALVLLWPSVSFTVVGLAYCGLGVSVFGKRPNGSMSMRSVILLLPYLVYLWTVWYVLRLIKTEPAYNELVPGVLIGRSFASKDGSGGLWKWSKRQSVSELAPRAARPKSNAKLDTVCNCGFPVGQVCNLPGFAANGRLETCPTRV
jgi:hypothetical protein